MGFQILKIAIKGGISLCLSFCGDLVKQFRTILSPKKANTEVPGPLSEQYFGASALEPQYGVSGSERSRLGF